MAIRSGFFNSVNGDRKYDANRFAEYFASFIGNGVFPDPSDGLQVVPNDDMTVTVKAGKCWINGYIMINDDDYILTLDPADGVLNRIDRIVARYDTVDREIRLEVKKGTFASSPVAPTLQRDADAYELGLADIAVNAGAVSINQADITDLRMNANYCGIVKGLVDQIDTTDLFAQFEDSFLTWFDRMKDQLSSDAAGNLQQQIDDLDQALADLKGYIGYTEDDIYGVEADFVNSKFTRLAGAINKTPGADFDSINAFGGRRRCNLADNGTVYAYYGEPGYVENGSNGQVMVEQPKFYYKVVPLQLEKIQDGIGYHLRKARYYVSDTPKAGFKVHPAFVRNGIEVDKIYLSAYEGCIYDVSAGTYLLNDEQVADFDNDKLSSIAGAKPASGLTQNLTRSNTRKLANNRGVGWEQAYAATISLTQLLLTIEYASMNSQAVIGNGVVGRPSGGGNEADITGLTTHLGNTSGSVETGSVSYRGEENAWGNIFKWIDGLNVYINPDTRKTDAYVADYNFTDDVKTEPYKHVGFSLASYSNGGYLSAFGYSEEFDYLFLPSEVLGNSALPVGDAFYNTNTSWRVSLLGGYWYSSSVAGAFYWYVNYISDSCLRYLGGRLVYVPQN